jgi:hypothetical protein
MNSRLRSIAVISTRITILSAFSLLRVGYTNLLPHVGHFELDSANLHRFAGVVRVVEFVEVDGSIWRSPELFLENPLHVLGFKRMLGFESDGMNRIQQPVTP